MFTMVAQNTRKTISAVAAVAIVSFSGLVLDQAHIAAAPRGTIEVGELTPVAVGEMAFAALPEVVVVAKREMAAGASFAATTQLPEIVVVAKRVAHLVAQSDSDGPSKKADAEGALLK
jgi:hypothetical protein